MSDTNRKAVIVISSHVARGSVGNRAAVFALETLGLPVWAIPTITLPWHPGHGPATRIVPSSDAFTNFLDDISNAPWIDEVGAILTGYMANAHQANETAKSILVTSAPANDQTGNLFVGAQQNHLATHRQIENPPNGPGDLTAAIFTGHHLSDMHVEENLEKTTASVFEILEQSAKRGSDELTLERDAESIKNPCARITMQMSDL